MKSLKEQSRIDYEIPAGHKTASCEQINTGCLQRIADATELMASNYISLQRDLETYKRWYKEQRESNNRMARRISALQGVITRMKKNGKA